MKEKFNLTNSAFGTGYGEYYRLLGYFGYKEFTW
jgi:hypothetical protein